MKHELLTDAMFDRVGDLYGDARLNISGKTNVTILSILYYLVSCFKPGPEHV